MLLGCGLICIVRREREVCEGREAILYLAVAGMACHQSCGIETEFMKAFQRPSTSSVCLSHFFPIQQINALHRAL
jgi:hypothetical protein